VLRPGAPSRMRCRGISPGAVLRGTIPTRCSLLAGHYARLALGAAPTFQSEAGNGQAPPDQGRHHDAGIPSVGCRRQRWWINRVVVVVNRRSESQKATTTRTDPHLVQCLCWRTASATTRRPTYPQQEHRSSARALYLPRLISPPRSKYSATASSSEIRAACLRVRDKTFEFDICGEALARVSAPSNIARPHALRF
jgi:hypothetical protein